LCRGASIVTRRRRARDAGRRQWSRLGTAEFREDRTGAVHIDVTVVSTMPGLHGLHIDSVGACSGVAFADAGGHFNP